MKRRPVGLRGMECNQGCGKKRQKFLPNFAAALCADAAPPPSRQRFGGAAPVYGAAYLELAVRLGLPLASLDDNLKAAAGVAEFQP